MTTMLDIEQQAFEVWLRETCPSGDVEAVQRQWLASSAREDSFDNFICELETKLIASQLREKELREYVTANCVVVMDDDIIARKQWQRNLCSQPTYTAEADALLAWVKELEDELAEHRKNAKAGFNRQLNDQKALTAARAVIEEAEKALECMKTKMQDHGMFESQYRAGDPALTRIREWKEGK